MGGFRAPPVCRVWADGKASDLTGRWPSCRTSTYERKPTTQPAGRFFYSLIRQDAEARVERARWRTLDIPANYRWAQYNLVVGNEIHFYDDVGDSTVAPDCAVDQTFRDVTGLTIQAISSSAGVVTGLGGAPATDNNLIQVRITNANVNPPRTYTGNVTVRAEAFTNLSTGLAPAGVSDPPLTSCSD